MQVHWGGQSDVGDGGARPHNPFAIFQPRVQNASEFVELAFVGSQDIRIGRAPKDAVRRFPKTIEALFKVVGAAHELKKAEAQK